jgi:geranylgeranyl diphosphate/geranylgeranyl-bacteriochlorophyllide a reductase
MAKETYDVVIVGAGPAGCMAAHTIGRRRKTLLIDQSIFPRDKPCGGILLEESIGFLKDFNVPDYVFSDPKVLKNLILLDLDNGIEIKQERNFLNVSRSKFDEWLRRMATENVQFKPSTKLLEFYSADGHIELILGNGQEKSVIRTKYLIAADGSPSSIRRALYGTETSMRSYLAVQEWVKPKTNNLKDAYFVFDSSVSDFYSWIIPKSHFLLIGSGISPSEGNAYQRLESLKDKIGILKNTGVPEIREARFTFVTSSIDDIRLGAKNVMLCGEAAGLISPSTAEGISYALRSGHLCAKAILEDFENAHLKYREYCSGMIKEIERKLEKNKILSDPKSRKEYLNKV